MEERKKDKISLVLVEDDEFLSGIYQTKFELEGFAVTIVSNGEEALKVIEKKNPEVVLLDILLPKLDGFAVLERLKKNAKTKDIPVILLTNLGQKDDVDKGLALGAADYLIKAHFKPSETVEKVRLVLSHSTRGKGVIL